MEAPEDLYGDSETAPMVFIVDDEAFNRDIAARFIKKMGIAVKRVCKRRGLFSGPIAWPS